MRRETSNARPLFPAVCSLCHSHFPPPAPSLFTFHPLAPRLAPQDGGSAGVSADAGAGRAAEAAALRARGVVLLARYLRCVRVMTEGGGGGVGAGWDCSRAEALLAELQR